MGWLRGACTGARLLRGVDLQQADAVDKTTVYPCAWLVVVRFGLLSFAFLMETPASLAPKRGTAQHNKPPKTSKHLCLGWLPSAMLRCGA
ncbi:hypothetical protein L6R29_23435 [Myxococcota bacterium]|nr:hypothetical protein [Myxococcota bacterium]